MLLHVELLLHGIRKIESWLPYTVADVVCTGLTIKEGETGVYLYSRPL